ncbi:MAG: SPASM domain-containing protein, partial [Candidatus Omnitrophica bacterium]|nr:SPASM domain-containing protein [Candidatus Omnitrophota bacterium]
QGKEYPFSYTPEEKQVIGIGDDWYARVRKKDSLCPAGHNSALIFPGGKVARCCQIGEKHLVGDFFDTNFSLLDSPLVCEADHCPCDESRLFGEESTDSDLDVKGSPTGNVNIDLSGLQELQRKNSDLNDREYNEGKIILESSPKAIFIQAAGPCNSYCVFCSRGPDYKLFNLVEHRKKFEKNLYPFIERAQTLIFTGSGEFLQLPDAQDTLDFFDYRFPHVQKFFSTNGSSLKQWVADKIISGRSNYTIHASLHASNAKLHKTLTRMDNFDAIIGQIKYIIANRKDASKLKVNLIFVATTLNIEDLPEFIKLASELKVDKVVCYYNFIYVQAQKYLSCFFKQDLTNAMFDQAQDLANRLGIALELPFRFGQAQYPDLGPCREAFSQIMFDWDGNVLPCDAAEDCHERLTEERAFMEVWNSPYYQKLRKSLRENYQACSRHCLRANPAGVNDFKSHVIYRGGG